MDGTSCTAQRTVARSPLQTAAARSARSVWALAVASATASAGRRSQSHERPTTRLLIHASAFPAQHERAVRPAGDLLQRHLAGAVARHASVERAPVELARRRRAAPRRAARGAASRGRRPSRSSRSTAGTTTSSASAAAIAASLPVSPQMVDAQVGCTATEPSFCAGSRAGRAGGRGPTRSSRATSTPSGRDLARAARGVHELASITTGSLPPSLQRASAAEIRVAISSWPRAYPFELHGVPQQWPGDVVGDPQRQPRARARRRPAPRAASDARREPRGLPKIRLMQAGK